MRSPLRWPVVVSLLFTAACDKDAADPSPPAASTLEPAASAAVSAPAVAGQPPGGAATEHRALRPVFAEMPTLTSTLLVGEVTDINESWSHYPVQGEARHCYAVTLEIEGMAEAAADFAALLRALGIASKTTRGAVNAEEPGLRISLVRTMADRAMVIACWDRDAATTEAGFAELLLQEPPLSFAAEIAAAHGGIEQVTLGWSATRGRYMLVSGVAGSTKVESLAAWFVDHGYDGVRTDGIPVERKHGDGLVSFAAVGPFGAQWVVELVHAGAPSPFVDPDYLAE